MCWGLFDPPISATTDQDTKFICYLVFLTAYGVFTVLGSFSSLLFSSVELLSSIFVFGSHPFFPRSLSLSLLKSQRKGLSTSTLLFFFVTRLKSLLVTKTQATLCLPLQTMSFSLKSNKNPTLASSNSSTSSEFCLHNFRLS